MDANINTDRMIQVVAMKNRNRSQRPEFAFASVAPFSPAPNFQTTHWLFNPRLYSLQRGQLFNMGAQIAAVIGARLNRKDLIFIGMVGNQIGEAAVVLSNPGILIKPLCDADKVSPFF